MRNFRSVIQSLVGTMVDTRCKSPELGPITSQLVGSKDARLAVLLRTICERNSLLPLYYGVTVQEYPERYRCSQWGAKKANTSCYGL